MLYACTHGRKLTASVGHGQHPHLVGLNVISRATTTTTTANIRSRPYGYGPYWPSVRRRETPWVPSEAMGSSTGSHQPLPALGRYQVRSSGGKHLNLHTAGWEQLPWRFRDPPDWPAEAWLLSSTERGRCRPLPGAASTASVWVVRPPGISMIWIDVFLFPLGRLSSLWLSRNRARAYARHLGHSGVSAAPTRTWCKGISAHGSHHMSPLDGCRSGS